jgi:hypothetical protein
MNNSRRDKEKRQGFTNIDFSDIEEKDPSLSEGHLLIYDREVPFELRLEDTSGP